MNFPPVTARAFMAMQNLNVGELAKCCLREIRPILPSLVRMTLLQATDNTQEWTEARKQILSILVGIENANNIVSILQINYHELEADIKKEQQLRQKLGTSQNESSHSFALQNGAAIGFERADVARKVRVILSELLYIQAQIAEQNQQGVTRSTTESLVRESELFDNEIYLEEVTDIICIALAELPSLLNIQDIVDILLYVNNGANVICWIIANMPDCFKEVTASLISNGDEETVDGKLRLQVLTALCEMNPSQALSTRTLCVELSKMPSLMLKLSLRDPQDLIAFVSGLLLGNDQNTRSWFAQFVRSSQKRKSDALQLVREELQKQLQNLVVFSMNSELPDECVVQASTLLRLYCALRGIAGVKFNDDEIHLLIQLVTSKPPPTPAGIRFVSLGLCMLIACPSLISQPNFEAKGIEWMQWLIKEEAYFESNSDMAASFGEMLLLMAIHFHSNQVPAIGELVCSTLGMKIPLRPNNTTRMKQIFTQEIFTEAVVTAHAVKVPVTVNLNADIPGYLPVHCIHQLLKSRAFSKHKVPIKSWIYKQVCSSTTPLHPVLPALIEVYVNSIILPNAKGPVEHTHKPLSEREILKVFNNSVPGANFDHKKKTYTTEFEMEASDTGEEELVGVPNITSQLLLLYYLLLYEDVRLNHMANILLTGRKVKSYTMDFMSELPIKYLLQQAQKNQRNFGGLFSPLLRLLVTHFPHLCLVDDWIAEETITLESTSRSVITEFSVIEAFEELEVSSIKAIRVMRRMLKKTPKDLWPLSGTFIKYFKNILRDDTPRLVTELYKQVWVRLNTVLPRRLWTMSINALLPEDQLIKNFSLVQESLCIDALQVLRCDERIFRCPDALSIVLRILQASLAASKSQLSRHIQDKPLIEKIGLMQSEAEREELKMALVYSQETVAVQILLEACLETENDRNLPGRLWALREVRGIICSHIHQVFISEITLAKLVMFQGFHRDLLSVVVKGIPSMHVCLHYIPELLNMPEMEKQIFAIDLASHLSIQYSLPKSLSIAKLCINTLSTLLGILSGDSRIEMFRAILPCIVRFAEAFPPLLDDCICFLMQLGRIADSQAALGRSTALNANASVEAKNTSSDAEKLVIEVKETFSSLLEQAVLSPKIY
ncbi:integrator complex subunit 2 [Phlebotomus argentipes]|uniref:integrator complex subunit 2 n=1 Tax=Phlebotomus argentipes TaxID=94469 RepID=UPI0028937CD0|nr:integrator complex subunit 2 [Phlebotomus argentipes]